MRCRGYAVVLFNLGGAYYHLRDYKSAAEYLSQSLSIYEELGIKEQAESCGFALARCLVELFEFQRLEELIQRYNLNPS